MKEKISLDICNDWISRGFFKETNKNSSPLVAFDWIKKNDNSFLVDFNSNIDLKDGIVDTFLFQNLMDFLAKNKFSNILGLRNTGYLQNPSPLWTEKIKDISNDNNIEYDEYIVDRWPEPMPSFEVPIDTFILRYSYDEYSPIDKFASSNAMFSNFMARTNWSEHFKSSQSSDLVKWKKFKKYRVIVLVSDVESIILHEEHER